MPRPGRWMPAWPQDHLHPPPCSDPAHIQPGSRGKVFRVESIRHVFPYWLHLVLPTLQGWCYRGQNLSQDFSAREGLTQVGLNPHLHHRPSALLSCCTPSPGTPPMGSHRTKDSSSTGPQKFLSQSHDWNQDNVCQPSGQHSWLVRSFFFFAFSWRIWKKEESRLTEI